MGSAYSVAVYGDDRVQMEAAAEAAFDEVRRLDDMLSNYKPESEWSQVNRQAAEQPVRVSPELFQLLAACVEYSRESEGAFDISVGPLMKVWGFYKGTGHLPHRAEVLAALTQGGVPAHPPGSGAADRVVRPAGRGTGPRRHRKRLCGRPHGRCTEEERDRDRAGGRLGQQHLRPGRAARRAARLARSISAIPGTSSKTVGRGLPEGQSMSTSGSYEKFFRAEGQDLQPHHGPAHRISGAGQRFGFGDHAAHHRQRGVGQAVFHQRPPVGGQT